MISFLFSPQLYANTNSSHSIKNINSNIKEKTYHFDITVYTNHPDDGTEIVFESKTLYIKASSEREANNKLGAEMSNHISSLNSVGNFCVCKVSFTWESKLERTF
jgi:predicted RNA-binding protein (virulence factor B family)